jgi:hypothetical protein
VQVPMVTAATRTGSVGASSVDDGVSAGAGDVLEARAG